MKLRTIKNLFLEWRQYLQHRNTQKDKNIWVFGAIRGQKYFDNAKYLFEYIQQNTDIQAVWISKSQSVVEHVHSLGYPAFLESSHEAQSIIPRAGVAVITHRGNRSNADLPFQLLSKKTFLVQLWHGIPLKKIAFDDTHFSYRHDETSMYWKVKHRVKKLLFPFRLFVNEPDLIPSGSEVTNVIYANAFRVPIENVVLTGYPRIDQVFQQIEFSTGKLPQRIIYMPTFRGSEKSNFDLFEQYGFSADRFDKFLEHRDLYLDIKLHPFNLPTDRLRDDIANSKRLSILECDDIYQIIGRYQVLITDYSSIYFDYLLLDRPILFAPFDKEKYLGNEREFYFQYDEVTPGPKAMNWEEVMSELDNILEQPCSGANERARIRKKFHSLPSGNCKRLYETILAKVN